MRTGVFNLKKNMKIEVLKIDESKDSTLSQMRIDGAFFCFVIEDGYRAQKVAGQTRIPDGAYRVEARKHGGFFATYRRRWGHAFAIQIMDVPGFQDILIHTGNTKEDTRGCLLVADQAGRSGPDFVGTAGTSTPAYLRLYSEIERALKAGEAIEITLSRGSAQAA